MTGGGVAGVGTRLTSTEVFDYNTGSSGAWREVADLPAERYSKDQRYTWPKIHINLISTCSTSSCVGPLAIGL